MASASKSASHDPASRSPFPAASWVVLAVAALLIVPTGWFVVSLTVQPSDGSLVQHASSVSQASGVLVDEVIEEGDGLRPGDRVTAVDGRNLDSWIGNPFTGRANRPGWKVGQTATYTVVRDGISQDVEVELRSYPLGAKLSKQWGILLTTLAFLAVAAFVFSRRPRVPAARALMFLGLGAVGSIPFALGLGAGDLTDGINFWIQYFVNVTAYPLIFSAMLHFWLVFPQPMGLVLRRRWVVPTLYLMPYVIHSVFLVVAGVRAADVLQWALQPAWDLDLIIAIYGALMVAVMVWRFRTEMDPIGRRQVRWVVLTFLLLIASSILLWLVPQLVFGKSVVDDNVLALLGLPLPLAIAVAILRNRLFDIDVIVNRTLVYVTLTGVVVGIYLALVGGVGALIQSSGNTFLSLIAVGVVAIVFQPLRQQLQRGVNRILYGERDDPYAVVSRLGRRMEEAAAADTVLPTMVETMARALKLSYVAIASNDGESFEVVAEFGVSGGEVTTHPLIYQGETVGRLLVSSEESFGDRGRRLLGDLARQAGVVVHGLRVTADLQRSREQLVTTREEERRRIRRDLHDGIGPTLASITMKLDAARNLVSDDPVAADTALEELKVQTQGAIKDIRSLVYELRPPALDQLGLVGAIREHATELSTGSAGPGSEFRVVVEAPQELPTLPAAVEVAAYRTIREALTNVVKHAGADIATIRLSLDGGSSLEIEIEDDGAGLPPVYTAGVGMASMRERAAELGGTCAIQSTPKSGTRVTTRLPLGDAAPAGPQSRDANDGYH